MTANASATSAVVPAVGTAGSLSAVRSLGRRGIETVVVSERERPPSFASRYTDEVHTVPSPATDLPGYRDALLRLARREDVGTIVPVREQDISVLAKHRETFAEHVGVLWPTFDQLHAVHDRVRLFEAAERAGVTIPRTTLLDDVENWDRERIVKGRYAILTADNVETVPPEECRMPAGTIFLEPGVEPDIEAIVEAMGHVPIVQDYVDGTEFCFRGLYRDGECIVSSQKRLVRGYKYSRGPSIYHEAVDLPGLAAAGRALLDELDWHGMASVGFIRDDDGAFRLLEVNPRFPSSIPVDIHAGTDHPYYYWRLANGLPIEEAIEYHPGTASHLLRGELVHLHSVLREHYPLTERPSAAGTAWDIATSLLAQPRFDFLSRDDPRPFVRDVLNTRKALLTDS